jgi:biotin-(acetyl-CoA carboxylase) ligase
VRVERPAAPPVAGIARDVDECGALVVETDGEVLTLTSGDVSHLRPA